MMEFEYHQPATVEEALSLLVQHDDDARLISGGTALIQFMKQRLAQPAHVVSLAKIPGLDYIREQEGQIRIGALTTMRSVETSPLVQERAPLVAETFRRVATVRIRNMATVGGGLAHGDPNQDPPPTLIALGSSVALRSSSGERTVPLADFFVDYYETAVQAGEVLTELRIPIPPANARGTFIKFLPRTADDYATVSVAAVLEMGEGGLCQSAHVVLGSAGTTPVVATSTQDALSGKILMDDLVANASEGVASQVSPLDDFRGSAEYKRDMAVVFTRRAVEQAWRGGR
jgi:carbon-monoxide dehydrogenase medium subunit